jgi:hypothetical protein
LLERYQHLIRFTTFGHIHTEEYVVNRSLSTNNPIGVEYIGGNFGSFDGMNPTTRLYSFHSEHHVPLDFKVYEFDIERANSDKPEMALSFDFKRDFDLPNLSPSAHAELTRKFSVDSELALEYYKFKYKTSKDWRGLYA